MVVAGIFLYTSSYLLVCHVKNDIFRKITKKSIHELLSSSVCSSFSHVLLLLLLFCFYCCNKEPSRYTFRRMIFSQIILTCAEFKVFFALSQNEKVCHR